MLVLLFHLSNFTLMTTPELFNRITQNKDWNDGYCKPGYARLLRHRHKRYGLSDVTYEKLFTHFGYEKIWQKKQGL